MWNAEIKLSSLSKSRASSSAPSIVEVIFRSESVHNHHSPIDYGTISRAATGFAFALARRNPELRHRIVKYFENVNDKLTKPKQYDIFVKHTHKRIKANLNAPFVVPGASMTTMKEYWETETRDVDGGFKWTLFSIFIDHYARVVYDICFKRYFQAKLELSKMERENRGNIRELYHQWEANMYEHIRKDLADIVIHADIFTDNILLKTFYQQSHEAELVRAEELERVKAKESADARNQRPSPPPVLKHTDDDSGEKEEEHRKFLEESATLEHTRQREDIARNEEKERQARELVVHERARTTELVKRIVARRAEEHELLAALGPVLDWYPAREPWVRKTHKPFGGIQLKPIKDLPPHLLTTRHYIPLDEEAVLVPTPDDRLAYIAYGSFEYSETPGDLDVYCTRKINANLMSLYRRIDENCRLHKHTVVMRMKNVEVEIHHGIAYHLVNDAVSLHRAVVKHMMREPAIMDVYERLKEVCTLEGVYASKYGLFRGIGLSLIAIAIYPTEEKLIDRLVALIDTPISFRFTMNVDGGLTWEQIQSTRGMCIMFGSMEVMCFQSKLSRALVRALRRFPPRARVHTEIDYAKPGRAYNDVRNIMTELEQETSVEYFTITTDADGKIVFACNRAAPVVSKCEKHGLTIVAVDEEKYELS